ncbi:MAG: hypothetical protein WC713_05875, partial [Candidatus Methylomirabilota bacterium]
MAGLMVVRSNAQIEADAAAQEAERNPPKTPPHIEALAAYIRRCFEQADQYRCTGITERLLACQRARKGEYSAAELAQISSLSGSNPPYVNITDTKCSSLESWIKDVIQNVRERPWALEPTPQPDLPETTREEIRQEVLQRLSALQEQGVVVAMDDVREAGEALYDEEQRALDDEAQEQCRRAEDIIADQLAEGGWDDAVDRFIQHLTTYPIAVLKGPVVRKEKRLKWQNGQAVVTDDIVVSWEAVDPHDFYPAPNVKRLCDSWVCEAVRISAADLSALRDAEGYRADEIDAVLTEGATTPPERSSEPERASLEDRQTTTNSGDAPDMHTGIEFWGKVQGKLLAEWGMEVDDENAFYPITALCIGNHVVRAIANPDPLGQAPYFVTTYERISGSLWGRAVSEKMADCQDAVNKCWRAALLNMGLAAGPQFAADMDALDPSIDVTRIYAHKVWQYHGTKSTGRMPIEVFTVPLIADKLQAIGEYFESKADDRTLIPRYAHGNEDVGGAGQTASGLSMLMNAAAKGVKRVIANIDRDIIRPAVEQLWRWDLMYLPEDKRVVLQGDIRVVPRGVMAALVREETQK